MIEDKTLTFGRFLVWMDSTGEAADREVRVTDKAVRATDGVVEVKD